MGTGGALSKNNVKIRGARIKITLKITHLGQFALQRSRNDALSVFEVITKRRVSQSVVSSWGVPNESSSKISTRRAPPRERKIRHALFVLFSQAANFLFSPIFSLLFPFFLLQMLWTLCQFDMSPIFSHHSIRVLNNM